MWTNWWKYEKPHTSNPRDEKSPKLIANLNDKEQYVLHMKSFKEYANMGLVLKKIIEL